MSEQSERPARVNRRRFIGHVAGATVLGSVATLPAQASNVALARSAFEALAKGEPDQVLGALDAGVRWQAVAGRGAERATTLDRRGATSYVQQMARSIASGERTLEVISVEPDGDTVRVVSAWRGAAGARPVCANVLRFADGKVVSVTEAAQ
jgi:ketosteroid isomerase-like protein